MKKVINVLNSIEKIMIIILFTVLLGLMVFGIVSRYGFGSSVAWVEQFTRLLFVWISFTGISAAAYNRSHLKVEALIVFTKEKAGRMIIFIGDLIGVLFAFFLSYKILMLTINVHAKGQSFSAMPWMPMSVMYISGALGMLGMGIRTIQMGLIPYFKNKNNEDVSQKEVG